MKTNYLFPHGYKRIGWIGLVPGVILGLIFVFSHLDWAPDFFNLNVLSLFPEKTGLPGLSNDKPFRLWEITTDNVLNELIGILFVVSALLVGFSREKNEDEYIAKIRLESLMWATYISYGIVLLALLFLYGLSFLYFMIINLFTLLIVFITCFHVRLFRLKRQNHEK